MKTLTLLVIVFFFVSFSFAKDAKINLNKNTFSRPPATKVEEENWPSKGSVYVGYGVHKIVLRGDFKLSDKWIKVKNSSTRIYLDIGGDWQKFKKDIIFNGTPYSSKVWMFSLGFGIGQEFIFYKDIFVIQPYLGVLYKYARFTDKDLVDGIGTYNLIRYQNGQQVGKVVKNAYGNAFMVDLGVRIGFRIKKRFEIGGSIGICPIKFSSANSLFGQYWAQKPYANDYYIKRLLFKADAGIKINF